MSSPARVSSPNTEPRSAARVSLAELRTVSRQQATAVPSPGGSLRAWRSVSAGDTRRVYAVHDGYLYFKGRFFSALILF